MQIAGLILVTIVCVAFLLAALGWLGLQVRPRPFEPYSAPEARRRTGKTVSGLPVPVVRFLQTALGDVVPVIESAVLSGRGCLRLSGVRFPARYRFTHQAGQGYRHYIEATIFGLPLFRVNEWYLDGHCRMELPVGVIEKDAKTDMGANLGLWGESVFLPAILLTDERLRWEPVDDTHARLVVPFTEGTDSFDVTFDANTGLIQRMDAMRWKAPKSPAKTLWRVDLGAWERREGIMVPTAWSLTWQDEAGPWFAGRIEDVVYNVDVTQYIRATGQ